MIVVNSWCRATSRAKCRSTNPDAYWDANLWALTRSAKSVIHMAGWWRWWLAKAGSTIATEEDEEDEEDEEEEDEEEDEDEADEDEDEEEVFRSCTAVAMALSTGPAHRNWVEGSRVLCKVVGNCKVRVKVDKVCSATCRFGNFNRDKFSRRRSLSVFPG